MHAEVALLVLGACAVALARDCERARLRPPPPPAAAASADRSTASSPRAARYALHIAGEPTLFEPGELYTVSVKGVEEVSERASFNGFSIWAESEAAEFDNRTSDEDGGGGRGGGGSAGTFQAYDTLSKAHDGCPGALANSTAHDKTEVQVMWTAPTESAGCVVLVARLGGEHQAPADWSTLERRLCPTEPKIYGSQPPIINPCCACDEAKYEVTFEGMWSRNTHPKHFPADERITRYSDVIGASHTVHYRFWEVGRVASQGLRELAEEGHTTTLEKELKAESDNIRTIIKARGMSWPRLGGATFAVFRVDARRHLVSLVARLSPSPDWVVGVSALELCRANCTWLEADAIDLFPYDAGTDSGITYMSRRQRTVPPGAVRALRPDWPRDERSPFYDPGGAPMKPFARMRLTRQRLYEKNCESQASPAAAAGGPSGGGGGGGAIMSAEREKWGPCATGAWGAWGACSVSCGVGAALRQRYYLEPARAALHACRRALSDHRRCRGPRMHCRAPSEYEAEWVVSAGACALSEWSEWSACSARACEAGVRVRTRRYRHRAAFKRCHRAWRTRPAMDQTVECVRDDANCTLEDQQSTGTSLISVEVSGSAESDAANGTWTVSGGGGGVGGGGGGGGGAVGWEEVVCPVSAWGAWSTCSARCGSGWRMRTRFYLALPATEAAGGAHDAAETAQRTLRLQRRLTAHLTALWNRRYAAWQNIDVPEQNETDEEPELEALFRRQLELCEFTLTMQDVECEGRHEHCPSYFNASAVCALPLAVGACRSYSERWFFDAHTRLCEPFGYTGCRGNANNFRTREQCLQLCANFTGEPIKKTQQNQAELFQSQNNIQNDDTATWRRAGRATAAAGAAAEGAAAEAPVDCVVGPWSGWSECVGDCTAALKLNYRLVLRAAEKGGRACPASLLRSRLCRPPQCRRARRRRRRRRRTY